MASSNRDLNFTMRFRIDSDKALAQLNRQFRNLGAASASAQKAADGLRKVGEAADVAARKSSRSFDNAGKSVLTFGGVVKTALAYFSVGALKDVASGLISVQKQFDRATTKLNFAVRDEDPSVVFARLSKEANKLGLVSLDLVEQFGGFAAAAMSTGKSTKELEKIFMGVAEAGVALKLSQEDMRGVFYAIQQMLAKGVVNSEEFRLQMAERLPIAMTAAVQAMHKLNPTMEMTPKIFQNMLVKGKIVTDKFLPAFSDELHNLAMASLPAATQSFIAASNRWTNSMNTIKMDINNGGFIKGLSETMSLFNEKFNDPAMRNFFQDLGAASGQVIKMFAEWAIGLGEIISKIASVGTSIFDAFAGDATTKAWSEFEKNAGRSLGSVESAVLRIKGFMTGLGAEISSIVNLPAMGMGYLAEKATGNKNYYTNAYYKNTLTDMKKGYNDTLGYVTGNIGNGESFYTDFVKQTATGLSKDSKVDKRGEEIRKETQAWDDANKKRLISMGLVSEASRTEYRNNELLKLQYDKIKAAHLDGAVAVKAYSLAANNKNDLTVEEIIQIAKQEAGLSSYTEAVKKNASEKKKAANEAEAQRKRDEKQMAQYRRKLMGIDEGNKDTGQIVSEANATYNDLLDRISSYRTEEQKTRDENVRVDKSLQDMMDTMNKLNDGSMTAHIKKTGELIEEYKRLRSSNEDWTKVTSKKLEDFGYTAEERASAIADAFVNAFQGAEDALVKFATTGKLEVGNMLQSIASDLARLAIRQSITGPLASMLGGALGSGASAAGGASMWSSLSTLFLHTGGTVGQSGGFRKSIDPSVFSGAQRFHSGGFPGLKADEVPAILQKGEQVVPKGSSAGGVSIKNDFNVTVQMGSSGGSNDPTQAESIGKEVTRQLESMVTQVIQKQMRPGGMLSSGKSY